MEIEDIEALVDRKSKLIQELKLILETLEKEKVDMLADHELRPAINNHIAIGLTINQF